MVWEALVRNLLYCGKQTVSKIYNYGPTTDEFTIDAIFHALIKAHSRIDHVRCHHSENLAIFKAEARKIDKNWKTNTELMKTFHTILSYSAPMKRKHQGFFPLFFLFSLF